MSSLPSPAPCLAKTLPDAILETILTPSAHSFSRAPPGT